MPRESSAKKVSDWMARIDSSKRLYDEWASDYKVRHLEDYYLGHQRDHKSDGPADKAGNERYIINLCYPTLETKIPSLLYSRPKAIVAPAFARADDVGGHIRERCKLREDTLNTVIQDRRVRFMEQTALALKNSFYAFGVVEVGYSADFVDNPNAGKPIKLEDGTDAIQPERIPNPQVPLTDIERLYVRHIPSAQFRVSVSSRYPTDWNDWVGYYEWVPLSDIIANPNYKNTTGIKKSSNLKKKYQGMSDQDPNPGEDQDAARARTGMVKLWKIWDLRAKQCIHMVEGFDKFLMERPFKRLPFSILRHHAIMANWYPLPPMFNWIHPQDEQNDIRESRRIHRRRFKRRFAAQSNVADEELEKIENGEDGVVLRLANTVTDIVPIPDAPMDGGVFRDDVVSKDDFMQITSVGGDQRGTPQSETATQARIISANSEIRNSFSREMVAEWISEIFRIMLFTIQESMALPFWIQRNVDPTGELTQQEAMRVATVWQEITSADLGDENYEVSIDIDTLSPATQDAKREQTMQLIALLSNPPVVILMMASDIMMRKVLATIGITSDREILEIQQALQVVMMQQAGMQGGAGRAGTQPGKGPQGASPGPTPSSGGIQDQLVAQLGSGAGVM